MTTQEKHTNGEENFFKKLEVPHPKSKEAIWEELSKKLPGETTLKKETSVIPMQSFRLAAAAAAVLLVGVSLFFGLYTRTIDCNIGEHLAYTLPDGSEVTLNAGSSISYNPFLWNMNRELSLEGEAFFEVNKGSTFTVTSAMGSTHVLGTSFNISTWNNRYEVYCATGKVKVIAHITREEVTLSPTQFVRINGGMSLLKDKEAIQVLAWKKKKFHFTARPLSEVFDEMERQYNIVIELKAAEQAEQSYTGHFNYSSNPEEALNLICAPFGFTFVKQATGSYLVSQN